ncbi:LANO_0E04214g1_1 [Lachancea nothofagi CBS 11611]|uniref:LANO_0E04214g1_1 n=1 Tax=Lachancea nothofagi CBS 11611 TaxID=1266666 RepID=A0A1G4JRY0_9SACH|nr:LANO_0E04214g1_1 [Lachancea nothofagi CBS 11611]
MDLSPLDRFPGELLTTSPSLESILADESPLSTVETLATVTTNHTGSSGPDFGNAGSTGTPGWSDTASLNNLLSDNALESIKRQRAQNKLIHLDPIPEFQDRNEIKPWLQKIFYPQGIEIVIERSDSIKVVFKCKASKRGRTSRKNASAEVVAEENPESPRAAKRILHQSSKKKRCVSPYNTCPFRVRATYSLKRKKWNIVVMNNGHSHPLKFNAESDDYKNFKKLLREQQDWDAVRKFDELECRTRFNLPIEPQPIPCDCGLTQEIKSFDIVLPTSDSLAKLQDKTVTKPQHKSKASRTQKNIAHALSRNTVPHGWDTVDGQQNEQPQNSQDHSEFQLLLPAQHQVSPLQTLGLPIPNWDPAALIDHSEEIDFTNLFLRPLPRVKQESVYEKLPVSSALTSNPTQVWAPHKSFMDELQFPPIQPICELNHTDHCNCIFSPSTQTPMEPDMSESKSQMYEQHIQDQVQGQGPEIPKDSPIDGYLNDDLRNSHAAHNIHNSSPEQSTTWDIPSSNHPHEYSNEF